MTPHALTFTRNHSDLAGVCSCGQWDALAIGHNHHARTALTRDWAEHQEAA